MRIIRTHETDPNSIPDQMELGWLIGLLEGEGSFFYSGKGHTVWLEMTDQDIVIKAATIIKKITGKTHKPWHNHRELKYNTKDSWILQVRSRSAVILMKYIVKYMGGRRRIQIWKALNKYERPSKEKILLELVNAHH